MRAWSLNSRLWVVGCVFILSIFFSQDAFCIVTGGNLSSVGHLDECRRLYETAKIECKGDVLKFGLLLADAQRGRDAIVRNGCQRQDGEDEEDYKRRLRDAFERDEIYQFLTEELMDLGKRGGAGTPRGTTWRGKVGATIADRAARSIADSVEGVIKKTDNRLVAPATDSIIDIIVKTWRKMNSVLFHQSHEPFTRQELLRWTTIVVKDLEGFYNLMRGRDLSESRAKVSDARAFDPDDQVEINQDQLVNELIIKRYAEQFENYAQEIEDRKAYYRGNREVVFIANQITTWLLEFRAIILSIKSLKDVAAKFGQTPVVISEMKRNIETLFEELGHAAIPSSYADGKKSSFSSGRPQRPSYPMSYGNDYGGDYE